MRSTRVDWGLSPVLHFLLRGVPWAPMGCCAGSHGLPRTLTGCDSGSNGLLRHVGSHGHWKDIPLVPTGPPDSHAGFHAGSHELPHGFRRARPRDLRRGSARVLPHGSSNGISRGIPQGLARGLPYRLPRRLPRELSRDATRLPRGPRRLPQIATLRLRGLPLGHQRGLPQSRDITLPPHEPTWTATGLGLGSGLVTRASYASNDIFELYPSPRSPYELAWEPTRPSGNPRFQVGTHRGRPPMAYSRYV